MQTKSGTSFGSYNCSMIAWKARNTGPGKKNPLEI
jgi:hypothetical protein